MSIPATDRLLEIATEHHRVGNLADARRSYQEILAADPQCAAALFRVGLLELQEGHAGPEAAAAYRQALTLKPEDSRVWGNLGTVLRELGDIDESIRSLKSAMALDPGIVSYAVNLGASLCRKRDFRAAEALLRDALRREPNRADTALNLGSALQGQGLPQDALEHFRRAVALRPNYAEAWNALADAYKALGDFSSAIGGVRIGYRRSTGFSTGVQQLRGASLSAPAKRSSGGSAAQGPRDRPAE